MLPPRPRYSRSLRFAMLLSGTAITGLMISPAYAGSANWTGSSSTDWSQTNNWDAGAVPTSADDVVIDTTAPNATVIDNFAANAEQVTVGVDGTGSLTIQNSGTLDTSLSLTLGANSGSSGELLVTGAGSVFATNDDTHVGLLGAGFLNIVNGGQVDDNNGTIGGRPGVNSGEGTVTVDGAGSLWSNQGGLDVGIGLSGTGTLTIQNGGAVGVSGDAIIGDQAAGSVTVTGAGSHWDNFLSVFIGEGAAGSVLVENGGEANVSDELVVGGSGGSVDPSFSANGELDIRSAGVVNADSATLGTSAAGYSGTVTIDGAGSLLNITNLLTVGDVGSGSLLVIGGGAVTAGNMAIGESAGAFGSVVLSGAGSTLSDSGTLEIGALANGSLSVSGGATATASTTVVGASGGGTGDLQIVGAGSNMTVGALTVGSVGVGTMEITQGGLLTSQDDAVVGRFDNGTTGISTVTINGSGSKWDLGALDLTVGDNGAGAIKISGSGLLTAGSIDIAANAGSSGAMTIDGAGSTLNDAGSLFIGGSGTGSLSVTNGGVVTSSLARVGAAEGSSGTLLIDGAGSQMTVGIFTLGASGTAEMTISNGGLLTSQDDATVGIFSNGTSTADTATIDGAGSEWDLGTHNLTVGSNGTAVVQVTAGGTVTAEDVSIGDHPNGGTGTVVVDGVGSSFTASEFKIGADGAGTVFVQNGGALNVDSLVTAWDTGSTGTITVTGPGSTLTATDDILVGESGNGTMQVLNGATVVDSSGSIASDLGVGKAVVDGAGSTWTTTQNLGVGEHGDGTLVVSNGGVVTADSTSIAVDAGTSGTALVTGSGSQLISTDELDVGLFGTGSLTAQDGGEVSAEEAYIGALAGSNGTAVVNGTGSTLTSTSVLEVASFGTGSLTIKDGGVVNDQDGEIGVSSGSVGTATVTGAGSAWNSSDFLTVGGDLNDPTSTGSGTLTIENGGAASADSVAIGVSSAASGIVTVNGVGSSLTADSAVIINTGTLMVEGGATVTDDEGVVGFEGNGLATVDGAGSIWKSSGTFGEVFLGGASGVTGTLVVSNGGTVAADTSIDVAAVAGSTGTLDIGADPAAAAVEAGTLDTPAVIFGDGTGTINFNHTSTNYDFSAAISGFGTLNQLAGVTHLTADSSAFAGSTSVTGGTLLVDGKLGAGSVNVSGGTIGGTGSIGGPVNITSGGTLAGKQGQTLSMLDLTLTNGANVNVSLSDAAAPAMFRVTNSLVLDGALNISTVNGFGAGVYRIMDYGGTLTDNGLDIGQTPVGSTATDFTVQTAVAGQVNLVSDIDVTGVLQFWDGTAAGNAGNGQIDGGNGTWSVTAASWATANGVSNGAMTPQPGLAIFEGAPGLVTVDDSAGDVAVTGMQFASDGYVIAGDAVTLSDPNTAIRVGDGTAAGAGYTATISAALTGSGGLDKTDLGTLVLTGQNNYSGGTTIDGGMLVGSATSFGTGGISDNAALVVDQASDGVFANTLDGSGSFTKIGAGSLNLTGTDTLTGATTVSQGRLAVNGSLADSVVTVQSGAILGGNGTVGGIVTQAGAIVAPGNSIGTLNVAGDVAFAAGSVYQVEANSAGQADRINATGAAALSGGTVEVHAAAGDYAASTQYTILSAGGGVSGQFDAVSSNLVFLTPSLSYDATDAYLTLTRNATSFASIGFTRNQIATGGGVEALGADDGISGAVLSLDAASARTAFDQLSGEVHASAQSVMVEDSRFVREAALDRLRPAFDGVDAGSMPATTYIDGKPTGASGTTDGIAFWTRGFGSWGSIDGDGNAAEIERNIGGFTAGADTLIADSWRVGVLGGYSRSTFDVDDRGSSGSSDNYDVGLYGGTQWHDLAFRSGVAYTWHSLSFDRSVVFPGFADTLRSDYNAATAQAFGELGYDAKVGQVAFEPFANLAYVNLATDGFTEKGGSAALSSEGNDTNTTFSTLGFRASTNAAFQNGVTLTARGMLGWRHAYGDTTPISTMAFAGGSAFDIGGVPIAGDAAVIEAGLDFNVSRNATLGLSYNGQFGSGLSDQTLRGDFVVKF